MSAIGLRVGPFEIVEEAAVPEAGPWFAARRTGTSRKGPADVLVRLLPPDATPAMRAEAQAAYEALRMLDDKRIPAAVGWFEGSSAMAVTAAVGPSLDDFLVARAEGRVEMTPPTLLDIAVEIAEALQHAHHRGIVHGHLTPASVVFGPDGGLWIWGFGEGPQAPVPPHWTPPERARGEPATAATDQWSLAALLVGLVTGKEPWPGADPEGDARVGDATPTVGPVLSQWPGLGRLLARMLDREPSARFPTLHPPRTELLGMVRKAGGTSSRRAIAVQLRPAAHELSAEDPPPAPRVATKTKQPLPALLRGFSPHAEYEAAVRTTDPALRKARAEAAAKAAHSSGRISAEALAVVQPELGDEVPIAKKAEPQPARGRSPFSQRDPISIPAPPASDIADDDLAEQAITDGNLDVPEPMLGPSRLDAPRVQPPAAEVEDVDIGLQPDAALDGILTDTPDDVEDVEDSPTNLHLPSVLLRAPTQPTFAAQPIPSPMQVPTSVKASPERARAPAPRPAPARPAAPAAFQDPSSSVRSGEPYIDLSRPPTPSTPPWQAPPPSIPPWSAPSSEIAAGVATAPAYAPAPQDIYEPPPATPPSPAETVIDGRDRGPARAVDEQLDDTRDDVTSPPVQLVRESKSIIVTLAPWLVIGALLLAVLWFLWMLV